MGEVGPATATITGAHRQEGGDPPGPAAQCTPAFADRPGNRRRWLGFRRFPRSRARLEHRTSRSVIDRVERRRRCGRSRTRWRGRCRCRLAHRGFRCGWFLRLAVGFLERPPFFKLGHRCFPGCTQCADRSRMSACRRVRIRGGYRDRPPTYLDPRSRLGPPGAPSSLAGCGRAGTVARLIVSVQSAGGVRPGDRRTDAAGGAGHGQAGRPDQHWTQFEFGDFR